MTSIRIALNELRRITAGTLPRLAVAALVLVPMLYAGLYLYANHDPYANLDRVPAALVVDRRRERRWRPARHVSYGPRIADDLVSSNSFDWTTTTAAEAEAGVADGTYTFALELPASFSSDLASTADFDPKQAGMRLVTNDANNYLAHTIANQVVAEVTKSIATSVSETAANKLLTGYADIHTSVAKAAAGASTLADGVAKIDTGAGDVAAGADDLEAAQKKLLAGTTELASGADDLAGGARTLESGASTLDDGLGSLKTRTADLPAQTRTLATGARKVANGDAEVASAGRAAATQSQKLVDGLDDLDTRLTKRLKEAGLTAAQIKTVLSETAKLRDPAERANSRLQDANDDLAALSTGADQVADGNEKLADSTPALVSGISSAKDGADRLADGAADLAAGASSLSSGADDLATGQRKAYDGSKKLAGGANALHDATGEAKAGAAELSAGLAKGLKQIPDPSAAQRKAMAATLGNPVTVSNESLSSAGDYGGGLAPFFLTLSAWIGGYVLFLLVRALSPRALATSQSPFRVALGGWYTPALLGIVQMVIAFGVVWLALGIQVARPAAAVGFLFLISMTFIAIVHTLVAWFGSVGKFLGLVLMVVQLVSAGGTFPWQTLPGPLRALHHVLPMSYGVDGMRQALYGGPNGTLARDVVVLACFAVTALLLTSLAAWRQRVWSVTKLVPELSI